MRNLFTQFFKASETGIRPNFLRSDSLSIVSRQSDLAKYVATLTLFLCLGIGNAWGGTGYIPLGLKTVTSDETIYASSITAAGTPASDWVVVPNYGTASRNYTNQNSDNTHTSKNPSDLTDNIATASSQTMIQIKADGNTFKDQKRVVHMHIKGITAVIGHGEASSSSRGMAISATEYVSGTTNENTSLATPASVTRSSNSGSFLVKKDGLDASKEYIISIYATGGDGNFYAVELIAASTPRTFKSGEKIYFKDQESNFDFSALWKVPSGNVYAYFWNDTENAWSDYGDLVEGSWNAANAIYEITVPGSGKEYTKVLFTRGNSNTCFDCSSTWDKTEDQTPAEGKNLFYVYKTKYADHIYKGAWGNFTPADKTIYFDIRNVSTWTTSYVRIGHGSNNSAWGTMTKVAGTKYLYSQTTSKYASHTDFAIANKAGWTGANSIDQPEKTYTDGAWSSSEYKMTMQTNYQQYAIDSDMYLCPKATSVLEHECQYYQVTNTNSTTTSRIDENTKGLRLPQYAVTSSTTNCTVALAKFTSDPDDVSPTTSNISSGDEVNPTQYVKVTVTPNTGYKFSSVSLTSSMYEQHTAAAAGTPGVYAILGDCEISATCAAKTCTVVFDTEGGSGTITNVTATYGSAMPSKASNLPTKTGYTFDGFWDGDDGTGTKYYNADGSSAKNWDKNTESNTTLYAKWTINSHTLTWDFADGSSSETAGTHYTAGGTVTYGTSITYPSNGSMSKTNYTFSSWSTDVSTMPDNDLTITAQWTANTYDVDFTLSNAAYSSGTDEGENVASYGTNYSVVFAASSGYSLPDAITVTIGGNSTTQGTEYTWNSSTGALTVNGSYITGDIAISITADADVTTYTVTYAAGVTLTSGSVPTDDTDYDADDEVTVLGNTGSMVYTGYTFRGWTSGDYFYKAGDKFTISANTTLTAVWDAGGSAIMLSWFDSSQGSSSSNKPDSEGKWLYGYTNSAKTSGYAYTITTANTNNKGQGTGDSDYMRLYYGTSLNIYADNTGTGGTPTTFSNVTAVSLDVKLKKTAPTMTITVGGTTIANAVSLSSASTDGFTTFTYNNLSNLSGKITISTSNDGSTNYDIYIDNISITCGAKTNFYVAFKNQTNFAGSTTLPDTIKGVPSGKKIVQPADPTASGYTFEGWYSDAACTSAFSFSGTITKDTTIYAKWCTTAHDVTWVVNGSEYTTGDPTTSTTDCDGISTMPTNPSALTCSDSFRGWSETNIYGDAVDTPPADLFVSASNAPTINEDKTFYAVFAVPDDPDDERTEEQKKENAFTSVFTSKAWEDAGSLWTSGADGYQMSSGRGVNVTISYSGANATTKTSYNGVKEVIVTYSTTSSSGAGAITIEVGGTEMSASAAVTKTGGTTDRTISYTPASGNYLDGNVKITVTCSTNSLYIKSVQVIYSGYHDYRCICPSLTVTPKLVTASTPIFITSAAEKTVRSQDSLQIVGSGLKKNATLSISSPASKFVLKSRTGEDLTTSATGVINTVGYIYYTPGAGDTSDGLDKNNSFTLSDGTNSETVSTALIGRHLPANFVIAAKNGDKWYALPADKTADPQDPVEITVNDANDPTSATTSEANVFTLHQQTSTVITGGNGQYVKLAMHGKENAPLKGDASGTGIGKGQGTNIDNDQTVDYWWALTQKNTSITNAADAKYNISVANGNTNNPLKIWLNAGGTGVPKWGLYSSASNIITEIRLIPWTCTTPSAPMISGETTYTVGETISLEATCATGADAYTTYTWYKGATWDAASAAEPVQAAAKGSSGYTFTKASCVAGDAGTYWCEASNGTCTAHNSIGYDIDVPLGDDHMLIWEMTFTNEASSLFNTHNEHSTSSYLTTQTTLTTTGMSALGSDGKSDATPKLENSSSEDNTKCAYVTFTVESGYQFIPDSVILSTTAVSNAKNIVVELGSNKQTWAQAKSDGSTPTKHNYTFSSPKACTGTVTLKIHAYASNTDKFRIGSPIKIYGTVEAYSEYSVTYDDNGADEGTVPVDENSPYEAGATVTVLGNTGWLFKSEYDFGGWSDGVNTYAADATFTMPSLDVTLTAVWTSCTKPGTPTRPTIEEGTLTHTGATFSWDPGGATADTDGYMVSIVKVSDGSTVLDWTSSGIETEGGAAVYTATGLSELTTYYFNVRATGASGYCDYGDTARLTFTTLGTPYTITYHLNGASWINEGDSIYRHGTEYTLPVAEDMSNTGYTFGGWYDNSGLTGSAVTVIGTSETGNKEFWAKWTENLYDVTYDANGGSGTTAAQNDKHYVTLQNNGFTAPSGKIFASWNTKSDGTGLSYSEGEEIELTADLKLYAIWATDYTISWGIIQIGGEGDEITKPNLGGGNYTITATISTWDGDVADIELDDVTEGVTAAITSTTSTPSKTVTITFSVGTDVDGDEISFTLNVPAHGTYGAKESTKNITIERCEGSGSSTVFSLTSITGIGDNLSTSGKNVGASYDASSLCTLNSVSDGVYVCACSSSGSLSGKNLSYGSTNKTWTFGNNNVYLALYSATGFAAGDVITWVEGESKSTSPSFATASASTLDGLKTTDYYAAKKTYQLTMSSVTAPGSGNSYTYTGTLPDGFTSSNWLIVFRDGSSFAVKSITVTRPDDSDLITPTLTWTPAVTSDAGWDGTNNRLNKGTSAADFTFAATQDKNSAGALTYESSNTSVATVNATGKVHIVAAGDATITATLAESGCYDEATASYKIHVEDDCDDVAGTVTKEFIDCLTGYRLTVSGHTAATGVTYQWYKDDVSLSPAGQAATYETKTAGEYYVVVTNTGAGHCAKASTNTVTVESMAVPTATKLLDSVFVKNGRRTPDIALVQTEGADNFQVKSGETEIWNTQTSVTTGFAGCSFYLGTNGIIYLMGQKPDGTEPSGLTAGKETLTFIASSCGGSASGVNIEIHKQAETTYKEIAFVVDGTKNGAWDAVTSGHADGTMLYEYLDSVTVYNESTRERDRLFKLYERNIYKTTDEKTLREHYSQFDAILITDDPSTRMLTSGYDKTDKYKTQGYVNAFGTLIDIRPILTMEAFVSALANWGTKGINGDPTSPNPRQYAMKLDCKNHAIFVGIDPSSTNVEVEDIDGVEYWTVAMVDSTKSPYSGVAYNVDTKDKPALQGFSASDVSDLMLLGEISDGALYAGVERQEEPAARLLLLGVNNKALPNALTPEGKKIIENTLKYLIETDMEKVDDCSNYFIGGTAGKEADWSTETNWSKGIVPNSPYVKARILKPCVLSDTTIKVSRVDIATSGKSMHLPSGECSGSLTIEPTGALIVGGAVRSAIAPYFNAGDLMPTEEDDLVLNTNSSNQAALIFNNDKGDTKATVNLYSLGRKVSDAYQFQYMAIPMEHVAVNPAFAGSGIYTYVWQENGGWERRGYYTDLYAFEGVGITTKFAAARDYQMKGTLASTKSKDIALTKEDAGENIIGNSWTAPLNIASMTTGMRDDDNIEKTVYIYITGNDKADGEEGAQDGNTITPGQWLAIPVDASGWPAWDGLKYIPSMQAYYIKVTGETTLSLDYKTMVRDSNKDSLNVQLRAPQRKNGEDAAITLTKLRVEDSKTHTDLYLFEGDQFSEAYDNGWEAKYMEGDGRSAQLYAMSDTTKMAVLATSDLEGTVLGFAPGKEMTYTFTFFGAGNGYYLNDLKLRTSTLISEENSYEFTYEEGDTNRFYISRTPINTPAINTGTDDTRDRVKARKILYNNKLYILLNGHVYSAEGAIVK